MHLNRIGILTTATGRAALPVSNARIAATSTFCPSPAGIAISAPPAARSGSGNERAAIACFDWRSINILRFYSV